jgi:hypothetical protein
VNAKGYKSRQFAPQIRFFADLVNTHVVRADSLVDLFSHFLGVPLENDIPQERSDHFVEVVLAALPWVCYEQAQRCALQGLAPVRYSLQMQVFSTCTPVSIGGAGAIHEQAGRAGKADEGDWRVH